MTTGHHRSAYIQPAQLRRRAPAHPPRRPQRGASRVLSEVGTKVYAWVRGASRVLSEVGTTGYAWVRGASRVLSEVRPTGYAWVRGASRVLSEVGTKGYAWELYCARCTRRVSMSPMGPGEAVMCLFALFWFWRAAIGATAGGGRGTSSTPPPVLYHSNISTSAATSFFTVPQYIGPIDTICSRIQLYISNTSLLLPSVVHYSYYYTQLHHPTLHMPPTYPLTAAWQSAACLQTLSRHNQPPHHSPPPSPAPPPWQPHSSPVTQRSLPAPPTTIAPAP